MRINARTSLRRAAAVASVVLFIGIPVLAAAEQQDPLGTRIFNLIVQRLCQIQQARGNRIILIDPARCAPTPTPPPPTPTPPPPPTTASLTIVKMVMNDDGGTATSSEFTIHLHQAPSMIDVSGSPQPGSASGTMYGNLPPGSYHVAETAGPSGYAASFSGACDSGGNVTLAAGDSKTCTITNDDQSGRLVVNKVTNPSGSTEVFTIMATGTGAIVGGGIGTTTDAVDKEYTVAAGSYAVSEEVPDGWMQTGNTCDDVVVGIGETKTCTITNTELATIILTKIVVNDDDGTATSSDFTVHLHRMVGETMVDVPGSPQAGSASGRTYSNLTAGDYHVAETGGPAGYNSSVSGDCAPDGTVTLAAGDHKACTITNDDAPPQQTIGHLVISEVQYDVASTTPGSESSNEWVELYNGTASAIDLQGWYVGDASSTDVIAGSVMIQSGGRAVIAASTTPAGIPGGVPVVVLHSSIGNNGFTNDGDGARLLDPSSTLVDSVGYGDNATVLPNVSIPSSHDGHSIVRIQLTSDTDTAADWADTSSLTPGS